MTSWHQREIAAGMLDKDYKRELRVLEDLFGRETVASNLPRLQKIHDYTERKWRAYARQVPDGRVKYLLIAEAPPWSAEGTPEYVLDPKSSPRTLMRALRSGLLTKAEATTLGPDAALAAFARMGLLIIDSLPFSMSYSGRRSSPHYSRLVELAAPSYLMPKLTSVVDWAADLRVAFSVEGNALALIRALDGRLDLGVVQVAIGPELIATNAAHYPDAVKLARIYGLRSRTAGE